MATEAQIRANRLNAKRSTGPRTEAGKARSRLNASKHGLAAAADTPELAAGALEQALREDPNLELTPEQRRRFAHASLVIDRVRQERRLLLDRLARAPSPTDIAHLARLDRYERRALSARSRLFRGNALWQNEPNLPSVPGLPPAPSARPEDRGGPDTGTCPGYFGEEEGNLRTLIERFLRRPRQDFSLSLHVAARDPPSALTVPERHMDESTKQSHPQAAVEASRR